MIKKAILFGTLFGALSACESSGDGTPVPLPQAQVLCAEGDCTTTTGSRDAVVTLSRSGCAPDQIDLDTVAVAAMTVTCSAGSCTGSTTSWRSDTGSSLGTVPATSYDLCGWIDLDDDGKDGDDVFSEDSVFVSGSTIELDNWGATYTFSRKVRQAR